MTQMRVVRVELFEEDTLQELQDAYDDWREDRDEENFMDWSHQVDGGTHHLAILYTE